MTDADEREMWEQCRRVMTTKHAALTAIKTIATLRAQLATAQQQLGAVREALAAMRIAFADRCSDRDNAEDNDRLCYMNGAVDAYDTEIERLERALAAPAKETSKP